MKLQQWVDPEIDLGLPGPPPAALKSAMGQSDSAPPPTESSENQAVPWLTSAPQGAAQGAPSRFLGRPTAGASLRTLILIIFMPEPSLGAQNQPEPVRTTFVGVLMNYRHQIRKADHLPVPLYGLTGSMLGPAHRTFSEVF